LNTSTLYKHQACRDTCIGIITEEYVSEKDLYNLYVIWYRYRSDLGVPSYCLNVLQNIQVKRKDWETNWREINI
jgi:hypothetical protein